MNTKSNPDFQALMDCVPSNRNNYNYLLRLMYRHVVIPFIGAGFSANFGYPSWSNFLKEQAKTHKLEEVKTAVENREYEKAATLMEKYFDGSFEYTLMQAFGDHTYKEKGNADELEYLPKIFRNLIITTNFDEVIEMLYAKVNGENINKLTPRCLQDVTLSHKRIALGEPTLVKLHGDIASRELVLTEQSYDSVYGKHALDTRLPLPSFLRDILLSRVILFLGCSLEDDRTLRVIEQSQIDGSIAFALLPLPEGTNNPENPWKPKLTAKNKGNDRLPRLLCKFSHWCQNSTQLRKIPHSLNNDVEEAENPEFTMRKAFLNKHNIIPIWYPYKQHDALKIFLGKLASQINTDSVTRARSRMRDLLNEGTRLKLDDNNEQAFSCYSGALEIIRTNPEAFIGKHRLNALKEIRTFFDLNGYAFESKEIITEIVDLTSQIYSDDSIELAKFYHGIAYAYENYHYYQLMLKAMQRSQEKLQDAKKKVGENSAFINAAAFIYTGMGYAFLKNENFEEAKIWYQKAEEFLRTHEQRLNNDGRAFLYNGLYRYKQLLKNNSEAIKTLEKALELRRKIYNTGNLTVEKTRDILNHIINTHSNKIRVFLECQQIEQAKAEFQFFKDQYPIIWNWPGYLRDAKRRILTDHGDILMADGDSEAAYKEYMEALTYRKYLHFLGDFQVADLYFKIAKSLKAMPNWQNHFEETIEYAIQAYVICEIALGKDNPKTKEIREELLTLANQRFDSDTILQQRLAAQQEFFKYRYDRRLKNLENELIKYYGL